jgi:hypothetical protein
MTAAAAGPSAAPEDQGPSAMGNLLAKERF